MCGNARPKLLEVSNGRTSQHIKGLFTMSPPVISRSALYGVPHTLTTRTPRWFPDPHVEHRTDSRRPLDQPPGTTTETDEGGDRRRRIQTKTETI